MYKMYIHITFEQHTSHPNSGIRLNLGHLDVNEEQILSLYTVPHPQKSNSEVRKADLGLSNQQLLGVSILSGQVF